jgi:hypothetical protein
MWWQDRPRTLASCGGRPRPAEVIVVIATFRQRARNDHRIDNGA